LQHFGARLNNLLPVDNSQKIIFKKHHINTPRAGETILKKINDVVWYQKLLTFGYFCDSAKAQQVILDSSVKIKKKITLQCNGYYGD